MLRLLLHSRDLDLRALLAAGLGADSSIALDSSVDRVRDLVTRSKCDVVLLDLEDRRVEELLDFRDELRDLGMPVVIVTNDGPREKRELARRGVEGYCVKPVNVSELQGLVRNAHESAVLRREAAGEMPQSAACGELVGSSGAARAVSDMIHRVAKLDVFVLITGENGTGKELIARAIHARGDRAARPFVAVSCGAIPESLIESELFGSEKGAFTGAAARRTGYFEEAGNGTLLLDEIGELSLHTQTRLLRVLQQREFARLGSSTAIPLRARLLFATNRNLMQMVESGTFREDLYYRLNVIGIHARPLRERNEDIPQLAQHFLAKYASGYGKAIGGISPDALDLLCKYAWPGNVRELENAIQRAIVLTDENCISPANLPEAVRRSSPAAVADAPQWGSFEDQLREYKIKLALDAVRECHGNKTLAAQSLNISRTYLHRLIREDADEPGALLVA